MSLTAFYALTLFNVFILGSYEKSKSVELMFQEGETIGEIMSFIVTLAGTGLGGFHSSSTLRLKGSIGFYFTAYFGISRSGFENENSSYFSSFHVHVFKAAFHKSKVFDMLS